MTRFIIFKQQEKSILYDSLGVDQQTLLQMIDIIKFKDQINAVDYLMSIHDEEETSDECILSFKDFGQENTLEIPKDIIITQQVKLKLEIALNCLKFSNKPLLLIGPSFTGKSTFIRLLSHIQH